MKKYSFTILELLLVVAVIVILASLLLPALKKAKESAYQIKCANTLKQLYFYLNEYSGDYNGVIVQYYTLPVTQYSSLWGGKLAMSGYSPGGSLYNHVNDYPKLHYTFACETNKNANLMFNMYYGFGLNLYISGKKMTKLSNFSGIPYSAEGSRYYLPPLWSGGTYDNIEFCHSAKSGVLFLDGHVQYYKQSNMPVPTWDNWYNGKGTW